MPHVRSYSNFVLIRSLVHNLIKYLNEKERYVLIQLSDQSILSIAQILSMIMCHNPGQSKFANREPGSRVARVRKPDQIGEIQVISGMLKLFWHYVWAQRERGGGPRVVVSTAAFHARVRGSVPGLGGLKETKNVSSPSTCESQDCGEPPWPRGSVLGLRTPGYEFRILCLEDSVISIISPSSVGSPGPV